MAKTKPRLPEALSLLREDHRRVRRLFRRYALLGDRSIQKKTDLFLDIEREITIHAELEEASFYPAIGRLDPAETARLVRRAREEHPIVATLLTDLSALPADSPSFDAKMKVLSATVDRHARWEERTLFPIFLGIDPETQERISGELRSHKAGFTGG